MSIHSIDSPIEQRNTGKGNPNAVLTFGIDLNNRQKQLLALLTEFDSRITVPKKAVNMTDLSALTAYTGDEFALFTKGNERLIIRGNAVSVNIDIEQAKAEGKIWTGAEKRCQSRAIDGADIRIRELTSTVCFHLMVIGRF